MDDGEDLYSADDLLQLSPFARLPHELHVYVAKHLSIEDLRSLRLTCRYTSSILRVLLAREIFVGAPWRDNATRLDALSQWPECAKQIRIVRICSRAVYEDEEQMAWSETQADPEPALWPMSDAVRAAHGYSSAERLRIAPLKVDLLSDALCRLKSLEELELTWERFPFMSRADMGLDLAALAPDGGDDADSELAEQLAYTTGGWQVEMLVDLASDMQPLQALKIAPFALDAMDQASYLPLIANLFNSLLRLDLTLTAEARRADPTLLSKLEDVLEGGWLLRELRLDLENGTAAAMGDPQERERQWPTTQAFLPKTLLPNLQSLTLRRCVLRVTDVGQLLRRHAGTLQHLELRDMTAAVQSSSAQRSLLPGAAAVMMTWEDLFHVVHHDLVKLKTVMVRGTFTDDVGTVRFKATDEEDGAQEEARTFPTSTLDEMNPEPGPSSFVPESGAVAEGDDPAPLERYLLRLGEFPLLAST